MQTNNHIHTTRIEVRYAETDQMGVVHHAVYPVWFELARTDYFRSLGASYVEIEKEGFVSPVLKLEVQYKRPTHYGEFVDIETTLTRKGSLHFVFDYKVFVDGALCSTGSSVHCFLKNGQPTRELPKQVKKIFPD
ncbi:MAG: acyl-CoA thioesterase [Fibrobacter sp.]|nr:acyl-CoA thioesterase [Fibrobacter sp.]